MVSRYRPPVDKPASSAESQAGFRRRCLLSAGPISAYSQPELALTSHTTEA